MLMWERKGRALIPADVIREEELSQLLALIGDELAFCEFAMNTATPLGLADMLTKMRLSAVGRRVRELTTSAGREGALALAIALRAAAEAHRLGAEPKSQGTDSD